MKPIITAICFVSLMAGAETKVAFENLPPAVQAAIREHTKEATISGISSEKEKGKTLYEVETKVQGKARTLTFDKSGALVETEDEVDLATVPEAARHAIEKRAAGATITLVEKVTEGPSVSYEATIKTRSGKSVEYAVNADGSRHKDD